MLSRKIGPYNPTPFFAHLMDAGGFNWWATFPKHSGFYAALGFGMLMHTYPTYREYDQFMNSTIKPLTQRLKSIDIELTETFGDDRVHEDEFWSRIGNQCCSDCAQIFLERPQKPEIANRIRSNRLIEFEDKSVYNRIARHFHACISLYESTETGIKTLEFCDGQRDEIALVVCLAVERNELSVLVHKEFLSVKVLKAGFPYYIKMRSTGSQLPALPESVVVSQVTANEPTEVVTALVSMVNDLSLIIRARVTHLDISFRHTQETLRNRKNIIVDYFSQWPAFSKSLNLQALQAVIELPVIQPPIDRPEHTITNCEMYPDEGDASLEYHGHRFHMNCLDNYLVEQASKGMIEFPCPKCGRHLPRIMLEHFPKLRDRMLRQKSITISNSRRDRCCSCLENRPDDSIAHQSHGCNLCNVCAYQSLQSNVCVRCAKALSSQDVELIKKAITDCGTNVERLNSSS